MQSFGFEGLAGREVYVFPCRFGPLHFMLAGPLKALELQAPCAHDSATARHGTIHTYGCAGHMVFYLGLPEEAATHSRHRGRNATTDRIASSLTNTHHQSQISLISVSNLCSVIIVLSSSPTPRKQSPWLLSPSRSAPASRPR